MSGLVGNIIDQIDSTTKQIEKVLDTTNKVLAEAKITTFSKRLQELKDYYGISNSDIAKATGKGLSNIGRYLSGEYEAKQDFVYALSYKYGVDPAWLMGFDVPMFAKEEQTEFDLKPTEATKKLFKVLKGASEEEIEQATKILEALRK